MVTKKGYLFSALLHGAILLFYFLPFSFSTPLKIPMTAIPVKILPASQETKVPQAKAAPKKEAPKSKDQKARIEPTPEVVQKEAPKAVEVPKAKPQPQPKVAPPKKIVEIKKPEPSKKASSKAEKTPVPAKEKPKKKVKKDDFLSVLKTVEDLSPTPPTEIETNPQDVTTPLSQNIEDLLSVSELDALNQQLQRCWFPPAGAKGAADLVVVLNVTISPDAYVQSVQVKETYKMKADPFFQAAAESAQRALFHPDCTPLKLPLNKYRDWHTSTFKFNPKEMF